MNVIIDTLSPSYRRLRAERDAELEALRARVAELEETNRSLETALDLAVEHETIRARRVAALEAWRRDVLLYLEEDENTEAIRLKAFAPAVQP